jgi:uroporphyrinogen decarboxylase
MIIEMLDGVNTGRTPVWFMRQAGRYMPQYRAMKEKYTFLQMCKTPELAAQITLQPVKKFGFDAAILFSDILLPVEAMGLTLDYSPGPVITPRIADMSGVERLRIPAPEEFGFMREAIAGILGELPRNKDLIGFAGAPFTVTAYILEGGSKNGFSMLEKAAGSDMFFALMEKVTQAVIQCVNAQADAGIRLFQLFDTWAGLIAPDRYSGDVMAYTQRTVDAAKSRGLKVIYFFKGGEGTARAVAGLKGVDVFSVDSSRPLGEFDGFTGRRNVMQGNLDPEILTKDRDSIRKGVDLVFESAKGLKGHIFNLGHGILPATPEENVAFAVDYIKRAGEK